MSAKNEQTLRRLVSSIRQADRAKTSGYDTQATVRRIEDGVAWVHIPGGVDETPVKLTIAANPGDQVQVRVAGGRAFLVGNATAPPTDDKVANNALNVARRAGKHVDHIQRMIDNGDLNGSDGLGVVAVIPEYCLANARVIPEGGTFEDIQYTPWSEEVPEYVTGKFYWMRTATYYTDESVSYSDPIFDMASQVVVEAKIAADNAEDAASTASGIANQALGKASATEKHFWSDSSGVHVSDVENSVGVGSNSQTISSDGTVLMRNGKVISSWTGDSSSNAAINFYDCTRAAAAVGDLIASYGRAGITQYINNIVAMALTASGLSFYTPDSDHNLQAVFGPNGTNLYVAGLLAMALASGSMKFYADDGVTELAKFSADGVGIEVPDGRLSTANGLQFLQNGVKKGRIWASSTYGTWIVIEGTSPTLYGSYDACIYAPKVYIANYEPASTGIDPENCEVEISGKLDVTGNVTAANIGATASRSGSYSIDTAGIDTYTQGPSVTLDAGVWVVTGQWVFQTGDSTGARNMGVQLSPTSGSGGTGAYKMVRVNAASQAFASLDITDIITLTSRTTVYLKGAASMTSSTAATCTIKAVRIK